VRFGRAETEVPPPVAPREADNAREIQFAYGALLPFPTLVCHYCRRPSSDDESFVAMYDGNLNCGCDLEAKAASERQYNAAREKFLADFPPFDAHRPCLKCGNTFRTASLHAGRPRFSGGGLTDFRACWNPEWEHIDRKCGVCGHESIELPLDSRRELDGD